MVARTDPSRRRLVARTPPLSLPWTDEARVMERCTACGACAEACPQDIIKIAGGTRPVLSFHAECTFCGACAEACPEEVFDLGRAPPWNAAAAVGSDCLDLQGVSCRLCEDSCEARALRARLLPGGRAEMRVDADACTGCGACVPVCPVGAIEVRRADAEERRRAA